MSDVEDPKKEDAKPAEESSADEDVRDSKDDVAMSALLKRSLGGKMEDDLPAPSAPLLDGVQRKIRKRSKGKFYADGWSTSQSRVNYALVAVAMLVVIAICYFALGPTGFSAH